MRLLGKDGWPSDDVVISLRDKEIASLKAQLAEEQAKLAAAERENEELRQGLASRDETISWIEKELAALQAKLDAVMLEYCPDEMTPEQIAEWGKHQVQSTEQWNETMRQKKAWADGKDAEPFAWASKYAVQLKESGALGVEVSFVNLGWTDQIELFTTPPTATALVEDFKRRCIEVVNHWEVPVGNSAAGEMACEWTMQALRNVRDSIESLPLIKEKK